MVIIVTGVGWWGEGGDLRKEIQVNKEAIGSAKRQTLIPTFYPFFPTPCPIPASPGLPYPTLISLSYKLKPSSLALTLSLIISTHIYIHIFS